MPPKLNIVESFHNTSTLKNPRLKNSTLKNSRLKIVSAFNKTRKLNNKKLKHTSNKLTTYNMAHAVQTHNKPKFKIVESMPAPTQESYNTVFVELLEELSKLMYNKGDPMRGRSYSKAAESIAQLKDPVTDPKVLLKLPGIGKTIVAKLEEYVATGQIAALENARNNPINIFINVYGIGPKKAKALADANIKSIEELREKHAENPGLLNDKQKIGLEYYEDVLMRIPRNEIEEYQSVFQREFDKISGDYTDAKFKIVGSYRRGAESSGDIDIIITNSGDASMIGRFVDQLVLEDIILHKLTDGDIKVLVMARLNSEHPVRRIDFLYTPPREYAFAILYFTGSKLFNTMMRQRALDLGYTLNEHGFHHMVNGKKGAPLETPALFRTEKDIFDFLNMEYKAPEERIDGNSVVILNDIPEGDTAIVMKMDAEADEEKPEADEEKLEADEEKQGKFIIVKKHNRKLTLKKRPTKKVKTLIADFKNTGISALKQMSNTELSSVIQAANKAYYNTDAAILTDNEYDIVREYLQSVDPENPILQEVGAPVCSEDEICKNKVTLPYEMGSMDKIKPDTNALAKWIIKYNNPSEYCLSVKLDGVSGLYTTEDETPKLYTRGNGRVGQDVSHLIQYLNLPNTPGIVIRGEFLITKENFANHFQDNANPRNTVSGMVNKISIDAKIEYLDFVAYECIKPELPPQQQFEHLETLGIKTARHEARSELTNEILSGLLIDWRESYEYEIDGVIVAHNKVYPRASGNPAHAFAFKMILSDQIAEAKVVDVLWTPSKDGFLKPRIRIESLELGGVTIEYATAFNAAFVENNKLGVGAVVQLVRSGDVIPHILNVTQPASEPKMPAEEYTWNDTHVDIILNNASTNATVQQKNIANFFRDIDVAGLSTGNVKRIMDAGFTTVPQILAMDISDFLTVEGFKEKLATKIHTNIINAVNSASLVELMHATNIFGRGLGVKKLQPIINNYPDILTSDIPNQEKIRLVIGLKGMGTKTAELFVSKIDDFIEFMETAELTDKLVVSTGATSQQVQYNVNHPLYGKKIVLTGFRDAELEQQIKNHGGDLTGSVSKNTFKVVARSLNEDSGKADKARQLGILISKEEFVATYLN